MRVFESGVEDIVDGLIRPMPYGDSRSGACDYCPYKRVCVGIEPEYRAIDGETSGAVYGVEEGEL